MAASSPSPETNGKSNGNGAANTNTNTSTNTTTTNDNSNTCNTYAIDIRYFLVMLVSAMSVFFAIGVLTAPAPNMTTVNFSNANVIDNSGGFYNPNVNMDVDINEASPSSSSSTSTSSSEAAEGSSSSSSSSSSETKPETLTPQRDLNERHVNFEQPSYEDLGTGQGAIQHKNNSKSSETETETSHDHDHDHDSGSNPHLPAGQHLLVDLKNVSPSFLNSERRLSSAMVSSVQAAGLTMLSYHCHSLVPSGVSCVGVLLESHISFHTWPEEGVITLDLFTCGENPLLPVVSVLEELFGVPKTEEEKEQYPNDEEDEDGDGGGDDIVTLWSHELRGFRHSEPYHTASKTNYLDSKSDLASWVITPLDMKIKKQVVATTSEFHRIDVWDVLARDDGPSYEDAKRFNLTEGDPRWLTTEVASPNRVLFINGSIQVSWSEKLTDYTNSLIRIEKLEQFIQQLSSSCIHSCSMCSDVYTYSNTLKKYEYIVHL